MYIHAYTCAHLVEIQKSHSPWFLKRRKMAFDGCGVTDGLCGTLCAKGLRHQCGLVRRQARPKVVLNGKIVLL